MTTTKLDSLRRLHLIATVQVDALRALTPKQRLLLSSRPVGRWIVFESKRREDKARVCLNRAGFVHSNLDVGTDGLHVQGGCAGVSRRHGLASLPSLLIALLEGAPVEREDEASAAIDRTLE